MVVQPFAEAFASELRQQADTFEEYGQESLATALRTIAAKLQANALEHDVEPLTLKEASSESGYSYTRIQELVAGGELPNAGKKGSPRIRRRDLPHKPAKQQPDETDIISISELALRRAEAA